MRKYKRLSEIISFSDEDKMMLEKIYDKKEALKKELRQIELRIFRNEIADNGKKDSIKVAINYLEELYVFIIGKYTSKMSEEEKINYTNNISDNFFAQTEERERNWDIALSQAYERRMEKITKLKAKHLDSKTYEKLLAKIDQEFANKASEINFEKEHVYDYSIGPKYNLLVSSSKNEDDIQMQILKDQLFLEYLKYVRKDENKIMEIKKGLRQISEYIKASQIYVDYDIEDANIDCQFALYVCEICGLNKSKDYDKNISILTKVMETVDYFATIILRSREYTYLQPSEINMLSNLYNEFTSEKVRKL